MKEFLMVRSFLSRTFDIVGLKQVGREHKARPRRLEPCVEGLESKKLLTGGSGVSLANGMLSIVAPMQSGNTASVSIDNANGNVQVILNDTTQEFAASQVNAIYYNGGLGGHDTFVNATSIMSIDFGWGGNNNFSGGTGADYMFVWGDGNSVHDAGGGAVAFTHRGHDTVDDGILVF
jgi:hypothetical protein